MQGTGQPRSKFSKDSDMQSQTNPVSSQQLGPAEWEVVDERFRPGLIARVRSLAANLNVCPLGQTYIRTAADAPSRRVRSTAKSLSGLFPSSKLGVTIGFESHTLELAMVTTLEYDDGVVAYFDQPPAVTVSYQRSGRKRSYKQTPDFLVIRHGQIVLIECKPLANLNSRNQSDPGFYVLEGRRWSCPPLQAAARELGIQHEVWTEDSFSPIKLRNLRLLGDYMGDSTVAGMDRALAAMRDVLDTKARANVADLLGELRETISVDHLYSAIARGKVAFDWEAAPLADPKRCFVYRNESTLRAFASSEAANVTERDRILPAQVVIALGSGLDWDGGRWHCTKADAFNVTLVCEGRRDHTLPRAVANDLIAMGVMIAAPAERGATDDTRVHDLIAQASEKDLRTGNLRNRRIARYLGRGAPASHSRTERRYVAHFKAAEIAFGNGYVGLLPGFSRCGNRTPRLVEEVLEIVIRTVNEHYLNATNLNKKTVFNLIDDACKARALQSPSYSWFCRYIDKLPAY